MAPEKRDKILMGYDLFEDMNILSTVILALITAVNQQFMHQKKYCTKYHIHYINFNYLLSTLLKTIKLFRWNVY